MPILDIVTKCVPNTIVMHFILGMLVSGRAQLDGGLTSQATNNWQTPDVDPESLTRLQFERPHSQACLQAQTQSALMSAHSKWPNFRLASTL